MLVRKRFSCLQVVLDSVTTLLSDSAYRFDQCRAALHNAMDVLVARKYSVSGVH